MDSSALVFDENRGCQGGSIRGVGPERAVALDQSDQPLRGEGRDEGGGDAERQRAPQLRRHPAAGEATALQRRRADDDRQRDRAREQVRLVAREAAPAGGGEGDAVAGDARRQRRRLGDPQGEAVSCRRLTAAALLGLPEAVTPWLTLGVLIAAFAVLGLVVAFVPGIRAARERPGSVLRSE